MKKILLSVIIVLGVSSGVGVITSPVYAADPTQSAKQEACEGINTEAGGSCTSGNDLSGVIKSIVNIISVIAGLLAVIMIIVSGMKYITSGGDAQAVAGAKKTLIYAVVGLIVVAVAQVLVRYVLFQVKRA